MSRRAARRKHEIGGGSKHKRKIIVARPRLYIVTRSRLGRHGGKNQGRSLRQKSFNDWYIADKLIHENTHRYTGCSLNIVFFPLNFVIFLNSASSATALVFYLPGVCTHTDTEGKQSPEYFKIFGKNTIFNEHPVVPCELFCPSVGRDWPVGWLVFVCHNFPQGRQRIFTSFSRNGALVFLCEI